MGHALDERIEFVQKQIIGLESGFRVLGNTVSRRLQERFIDQFEVFVRGLAILPNDAV